MILSYHNFDANASGWTGNAPVSGPATGNERGWPIFLAPLLWVGLLSHSALSDRVILGPFAPRAASIATQERYEQQRDQTAWSQVRSCDERLPGRAEMHFDSNARGRIFYLGL